MNPQTLVLADDHALFRAGLCSLIDDLPGYEVVAQAQSGAQAIQMAALHRPHLMVLDIAMPGLNGLQALPQIKQACPDTRVLMVSMYSTGDFVMQALRAGADGFLCKDAAAQELHLALQAVSLGYHYLCPAVTSAVVEEALAARPHNSTAGSPVTATAELPLTPRQIEILRLVVAGHSIKEIAHRLELSIKTVEAHRAQILKRLDIRNIPQLVLYAVRHGLVAVELP